MLTRTTSLLSAALLTFALGCFDPPPETAANEPAEETRANDTPRENIDQGGDANPNSTAMGNGGNGDNRDRDDGNDNDNGGDNDGNNAGNGRNNRNNDDDRNNDDNRASNGRGNGGGQNIEQHSGELDQNDEPLRTGEYADSYFMDLEAGQYATIEMTSDDFDTYLIVLSPSGEQWENDDATQGDTGRSLLEGPAPESGRYQIVTTSYEAGETGRYQLSMNASGAGGGGSSNRGSGSGGK